MIYPCHSRCKGHPPVENIRGWSGSETVKEDEYIIRPCLVSWDKIKTSLFGTYLRADAILTDPQSDPNRNQIQERKLFTKQSSENLLVKKIRFGQISRTIHSKHTSKEYSIQRI